MGRGKAAQAHRAPLRASVYWESSMTHADKRADVARAARGFASRGLSILGVILAASFILWGVSP
jgi:hypothetical protein